MDDKVLERKLLNKFYIHKVWGKHHFREDTLLKGFPSHLKYRVKIIAEDLRKRGYLIKFPTGHGMQWYANIKKVEEIKKIVMPKD